MKKLAFYLKVCAMIMCAVFVHRGREAHAQQRPRPPGRAQAEAPEAKKPAFDLLEEIKKEKTVVKRDKYGKPRRDPFTNPLTRKVSRKPKRIQKIYLSDEEQERVLAAALLALEQRGRERLRRRLGPETASALDEVLAAHAKSWRRGGSSPSPDRSWIRAGTRPRCTPLSRP